METNTQKRDIAELDLIIHNMTGEVATQTTHLLQGAPGIEHVRLTDRGAFIRYDAATITAQQICELLRPGGLRVGIFQDSKTGHLGHSSQ